MRMQRRALHNLISFIQILKEDRMVEDYNGWRPHLSGCCTLSSSTRDKIKLSRSLPTLRFPEADRTADGSTCGVCVPGISAS